MEAQGRRHVWLAAAAGVSPSLVTRILDGERTPSPRFRRIAAEALHVPEDELFPEQAEAAST